MSETPFDRSETSASKIADIRTGISDKYGVSILEVLHKHDLDGIVFYKVDGTIVYANDAAMRLFKFSDDMVGSNYVRMLQGGVPRFGVELENVDGHRELVLKALEGDEARGNFEIVDNGVRRYVEVIYGPAMVGDEVIGLLASYRDNSEQHQMAMEIANASAEVESQRHLMESVLLAMNDGLIVLDADMNITLANPAAARSLGASAEGEFSSLEELVAASGLVQPDVFVRQIRESMRSRSATSSIHLVSRQSDDDIRCVEFSIDFTGVEGRAVTGLLRDVTEWQQLQQVQLLAEIGRLGAEKGSFEELAVRLLDTVFEDLNIDIAVLAIFDRGRLRPVGWRGLMIEPETILDPMENYYVSEAVAHGTPVEGDGAEWDGSELTGTHFVVPLVAGGVSIGTLHLGALQTVRLFDRPGVGRGDPAGSFERFDSTFLRALGSYIATAIQNVRLFEQNAAERARLETLVHRIPDGVLLWNANGDILLANRAATEILEFELKNLNSDSRPYRMKDAEGRPLPRANWPFFRAARSGQSIGEEVVYLDFGEYQKALQISVVPIPSPDGQVASYLGTLQDVTARDEQERRKDEFLSVASHELRSPLTPLTGFLQMIRRQARRGNVDEELVRRSEEQVTRLARLIDDLLDMTRIETGRMILQTESCDLGALVRGVADTWENHPKNVDVVCMSSDDAELIAQVDPGRIDQLVTNVIDNAVKYSSEGGEVRVVLSSHGNFATIRVEDDGSGIPEADLEHLFDRFYQSAPGHQSGSMGLGLYISKQIVEQHAGEIEVHSTVDVGTTVEIRLPLRLH